MLLGCKECFAVGGLLQGAEVRKSRRKHHEVGYVEVDAETALYLAFLITEENGGALKKLAVACGIFVAHLVGGFVSELLEQPQPYA